MPIPSYKSIRLFILGGLLGTLSGLIVAGTYTDSPNLLPSLIIPYQDAFIHIHHWMWGSVLLIGLIITYHLKFFPKQKN